MPLFHRSSKPETPACPTSQKTLAELQNTVQRLQKALAQPAAAIPPARKSHYPEATAAVAIGLAAIAGAAVYLCRSPRIPAGVEPLQNFHLDRYLGKWYEVARIEHGFEKGLQRTQAEYTRNSNGSIQVINRGYDPKRGVWKLSHGTAKPTIAPDIAALKVAFFGPFYGGYNVVALDSDYRWAMVIGSSLDYFWILSRQPSLPEGVEAELLQKARDIGVDTQKILWVHQDGVNPTGSYFSK